MQRRLLFATLTAGLLVVGCSDTTKTLPQAPVSISAPELGHAAVTVRWPSQRTTQAVPYLASRLILSLDDTYDKTVQTMVLDRSVSSATLSIQPGTNYRLTVTADTASESAVAIGTSARFNILRNRSTDVSLELLSTIKRFAGSADAYQASSDALSQLLNAPGALALSADNLLVADINNNSIKHLGPDGSLRTVAGGGTASIDMEPEAVNAQLTTPHGVITDADGNIWIGHNFTELCLVPKRDGRMYGQERKAGHLYRILTGNGTDPNIAFIGFSMTADTDGSILLTSQNEGKIYRLSSGSNCSTVLLNDIGGGTALPSVEGVDTSNTSLKNPQGIAVDLTGNLAIADFGRRQVVYVCRKSGIYFGRAMVSGKTYLIHESPSLKTVRPIRVAFDRDGHLYFASNRDNTIRKIARDTGALSIIAGQENVYPSDKGLGNNGPAINATLQTPVALAITSDNRLYFSDTDNHQIRTILL